MKFNLRIGDPQSNLLEWILSKRGVELVSDYLEANPKWLQDPEALDNIDKAYEAFHNDTSSRVLTVVDSDMDGYCSSGILKNYLEKAYQGLTVDYFIHENKQHGLEDVVERIDLNDYSIVFVPDAGSNDGKYAKEYPNTTFIVLDHHDYNPDNAIPENMIVVNPQLSPNYKNKDLSGTGVTWQYLRYLDKRNGHSFADAYWDMVAVSIISDMMDLRPLENRVILKRGLENPNNNMILALGDKAAFQLKGELTPMGVAFYIAPLVNAMCRVGTMDQKERMFLAFSLDEHFVESGGRGMDGQFIDVATESARECVNAKGRQTRLRNKMADLSQMTIVENDMESKPVLVIEMDSRFEKIPRELNGLGAQEISKKYDKPVLLGRVSTDGFLRGSVRAPEKLPVPSFKEFLAQSGLFEYTEGHASAFGYSIPVKNLHKLDEYFETNWEPVDDSEYVHQVDYQFTKADTILKTLCEIKHENRFLWGRGVDEPLVGGTLNVSQSDVRVMGNKGDTIKITKPGIEFIMFRQTPEQVDELIKHNNFKLHLTGRCDMNEFRGSSTPQVTVVDYELEEGGQFLF